MTNPGIQFHGSDLEKIEELYGINKSDIKPHASNVNPLGISPVFREVLLDNVDIITSYPDREYTNLRNTLSDYVKVAPEHIIVSNGSSSLISLYVDIVSPKKTMLIQPTYSEYKRELILTGSLITDYILKEEDNFVLDPEDLISKLDKSYDLLVMCNPNNPTSTAVHTDALNIIFAHCRENGIKVLVDETYVEFAKDYEHTTSASLVEKYDNIMIARGVSKFFAAPGLRLGYGLCSNASILDTVRTTKTPWGINSFAAISAPMFNDKTYISLTQSLIHTEQNLVYSALCSRKTIKVYKPEANFVLIKLLKEDLTASAVFTYCIKKGIMIRDCSDFTGLGDKYIRMCFLNPEDNDNAVNSILEIV